MATTNKFLFSLLTEQNADVLFKTKEEFLPVKEQPWLLFIKNHYARFNKLPDVVTVESKFNIALEDNTDSADFWLEEVIDKFRASLMNNAIIDAAKNQKNPKSVLEVFQQALVDYNVETETKVWSYGDGGRRKQAYLDSKGTGGITHYSTGDSDIDKFSLGYKAVDMWTLGGSEGVGKTWVLCRAADNLDQYFIQNDIDKDILIVSGEMGADELEQRLDAIRCEISYSLLSKGELSAGEERKLIRYLSSIETRIRIIDSFDNFKDIERLMDLLKPGMVFLDGSHLLAKSYDWTDVARVTADMKKATRNKKIPIFNTTHLKADKGKSTKGGSIDDFAYTKGYTRDSDIVGVMFMSEMMEIETKVGIDWVKVRRGDKCQMIYQNTYGNCSSKLVGVKSGAELAMLKASSSGGKGRGGDDEAELDY